MTVTLLSLVLLASPPDAAPAAAKALTYSKDIAPIFQRRCQDCHRPGEVAPMSLLTYEDARPWARSIKKHVERREMPPWHADPKHGKFQNDPTLSDEEIAQIVTWVDAGAPEGDPKDLPKPHEFVEGWRIGKPDVVFTMPKEFVVPATGTVRYQYITIPTDFKEDVWVQAAEARPGNREVVHHIIVFILEPGRQMGKGRDIWSSHLCGTAPGEGPDVFPPGTGKLIPAGSRLLLQMHYTPNGKEQRDRTQVGLVLSKTPLRRVNVRAAMNAWFLIPSGEPNHEVRSQFTFRRDAELLGIMPHMHLRGKDFLYEIVHPDGKRETLLSVPRWDFNWQHHYSFAEPLKVPAGSRVECTAHYDNSPANKANPDPTKSVRWGDQTWEEMMIGFVTFLDADPNAQPLPAEEDSKDDDPPPAVRPDAKAKERTS
jgi:mono/diheme cytochrome c family protein